MRVLSILLAIYASYSVNAEEIFYEITDLRTGKLVAQGVREYSKDDVILNPYTSGGKNLVEKYVELEKGFKVGARIFARKELDGFGLVAKLTPKDFSWEWYNHVETNVYKKLMGRKGLVKVRVSGLPMQEILEEVEFLDDAVLTFHLGGPDTPESHEIFIKEGSVLRFD